MPRKRGKLGASGVLSVTLRGKTAENAAVLAKIRKLVEVRGQSSGQIMKQLILAAPLHEGGPIDSD